MPRKLFFFLSVIALNSYFSIYCVAYAHLPVTGLLQRSQLVDLYGYWLDSCSEITLVMSSFCLHCDANIMARCRPWGCEIGLFQFQAIQCAKKLNLWVEFCMFILCRSTDVCLFL